MKLLLDKITISWRVNFVAKQLNEKFKNTTKEVCLVGILNGVYIFLADLTRKLTFKHTVSFINVKSYNGQVQEKVQITNLNLDFLKNKTVIIVDELLDKGTTLLEVSSKLKKELQTEEVFTCVLFQKLKNDQHFKPDFVGIDCLPDVWVIGYGLDSNGYYRNLEDLYAVEKIEGVEKSEDDSILTNDKLLQNTIERILIRLNEC